MPLWEDYFIDVTSPPMTNNTSPAPFVTSASSAVVGYEAWRAFSHNPADRWRSEKFTPANASSASSSMSSRSEEGSISSSRDHSLSSSTPQYVYGEWLKIDLGTPHIIRHYDIVLPETDNAPTTWTLEGSTNNVSWDVLDYQKNVWVNPASSRTALLLVVDSSGSMGTAMDGSTRMSVLKTALINLVNNLPAHVELVGLIDFEFTAREACPFVDITNPTKKTQLINSINALSAGGGTYYTPALNLAVTMFSGEVPAGYKRSMFFLSDGEDNDPDRPNIDAFFATEPNALEAIGVSGYTCAFSTATTCATNYYLSLISSHLDGACYEAPTGTKLAEILDGIYNTAEFTFECINRAQTAYRYLRLNIFGNIGDTGHTEVVELSFSEQNLGECESSSSSASLSTLSSLGLTSASSISSESSSSQSYSSRSSISSISSSSMSSTSSSSPSSASSSSSSSSISSSTSSSTSISSASSISSSSSSSSSSSVYKALVDSYRKNLTYLSHCTDTDSITNPEVGDSGLMTVAGFLDSDSTAPTYVEPELVHTYMGGLKKTIANKGLIYCLDAQRFLSMRGGMVRLFLKLPYKIQDGVYAPLENKEDSYLQDLIIWAVNMGDYYITQPGLYAAFTPRGIEFTHWSTGGKHTILDTTTNIDAGQDAVIAFAWNSETLFENFRATMAIFVNDVMTSHYSLGKVHPDSLRNLYAGRASSSHANLCLLGAQSEKNHLLGSLRRIELYSSLDEPYYYDEPSSSSVVVPRSISTARMWSAPRADETHLGVSFEFRSSGEALQPLWFGKTNVTSYASPSHAATIYGHLATFSSCTESEAEAGVPYGSYTYPVDASWYGSDNLPCTDMNGTTRFPSNDTYCTIGRSGNRTITVISDTYQKDSLHFNGSIKLYRATVLGTRVIANSGAVEVVTSVNVQQDTFSWAFKSDTVGTVVTFELDWEIGEAALGSTSSSTTSQSLSSQTSSSSSSSTADLHTSSSSKSYDRQCSSAALPFSFEAVKGSPVKNVAADFYSVFSANVNVAALTGVPPDFYSVDAGAAVTRSSVPERAGIVRGGKVSDAGER